MKLTKDVLKNIILQEMSKFGKMKNVEDVVADECDADELADSLAQKKDYTVNETALKNKINKALALKLEERRLTARIKKIREARANLARDIVAS